MLVFEDEGRREPGEKGGLLEAGKAWKTSSLW